MYVCVCACVCMYVCVYVCVCGVALHSRMYVIDWSFTGSLVRVYSRTTSKGLFFSVRGGSPRVFVGEFTLRSSENSTQFENSKEKRSEKEKSGLLLGGPDEGGGRHRIVLDPQQL